MADATGGVPRRRVPAGEMDAVCDRCGAKFPSGIEVSGRGSALLVGNTVGPCPVCGGLGHVPDGLYEFEEAVEQAIAATTPDDLARIRDSLEELVRLQGESLKLQQAAAALPDVPAWRRVGSLMAKFGGPGLGAANFVLKLISMRHGGS